MFAQDSGRAGFGFKRQLKLSEEAEEGQVSSEDSVSGNFARASLIIFVLSSRRPK